MVDDTTSSGAQDNTFTFDSAATKEFPLAPIGEHSFIVARALFEMRPGFNAGSPEEPNVNLRIESRMKYVDDSGKERAYSLFKILKISDHPDSNMFAFFRDVLGIPVPLVEVTKEDGTKVKRISFERLTKEVTGKDGNKKEEIHMPQFENLEFKGVVKHKKKTDSDKMRDFIDSIYATPEQQASNAALFSAPQA